jgi:hypothetical protein
MIESKVNNGKLSGCDRLINSQTAQMVDIRSAATPDKYKMAQVRLENCSQRRQAITIQVGIASYRVVAFITI